MSMPSPSITSSSSSFGTTLSSSSAPTMSFHIQQESAANALDVSRDHSNVVIAGKRILKVFSIGEETFHERLNLRSGKSINLNYSCNDVVWSPHDENLVATAATNGAVVLWNLAHPNKTKLDHVFSEHKRTVNKVNFHPLDPNCLISGSQDSTTKLFDLRTRECVSNFASNMECIRDVQFSPHSFNTFASVSENGGVSLWDLRKPDRPEKNWQAHAEYVFALDWHPEIRGWFATAGRDKSVKVWNALQHLPAAIDTIIHTIGPVGKIKWRPNRRAHIASAALALDFTINIWDIRRQYVPLASFEQHKDVTTGIVWRGSDPQTLLSTSRDGSLFQHSMDSSIDPNEKANPVGLSINNFGVISHTFRDINHSGQQRSAAGFSLIDFQQSALDSPSSNALNPLASSLIPVPPPMPNRNQNVVNPRRGSIFHDSFRHVKSEIHVYQNMDPLAPVSSDHENNIVELTSNDWIQETAKRYRLSGSPMAELCDYNASVANSLNRRQVSLAWTTIKTLFRGFDFDFASEVVSMQQNKAPHNLHPERGGAGEVTLGRDRVGTGTGGAGGDKDQQLRLRHLSTKLRNLSGPGTTSLPAGEGKSSFKREGSRRHMQQQLMNMMSSNASGRGTAAAGSDSETEDAEEENEMTLTNIASGHLFDNNTLDFFGDAGEIQSSGGVETFLVAGGGGGGPYASGGSNSAIGEHHWSAEAFGQRHEIKEALRDESETIAEAPNNIQPGEFDPDNIKNLGSAAAGPEESANDVLIDVDTIPAYPAWAPEKNVADMLFKYAEMGDVQSSVSMYLVIGHERLREYFSDDTLENWFMAYVDLLQRFQLVNQATQIIQMSPIKSVNEENQNSTTFYSNCSTCSKALSRKNGAWFCARCNEVPNLCAICKKAVKGIFVWCQGCGHGGHYHHIRMWYETHKQCPTGCGHYCQYQ